MDTNFKVHLVGHTPYPIETLYAIWKASRDDEPFAMEANKTYLEDLHTLRINRKDLNSKQLALVEDVDTTVMAIMKMQIPISSMIGFTFMIENMSVAFREQLVRHAKFMDFWMQSMRIRSLDGFSAERLYQVPESIQDNEVALEEYKETMAQVGRFYNSAVANGIPMEDARMVMPQATLHRGSLNPNLRSLIQMLRERSCQILQLSLWKPFLLQVADILREIDPLFDTLLRPPCIEKGCYKKCTYMHDNERRFNREDKPLPCTLYMGKEMNALDCAKMSAINPKEWDARMEDYSKLWGKSALVWNKP